MANREDEARQIRLAEQLDSVTSLIVAETKLKAARSWVAECRQTLADAELRLGMWQYKVKELKGKVKSATGG